MVSHNKGLLLFYLAFFTSCYYAQTLDSVWFQSSNYSYCNSNDHISVSSVYRYFNVTDSAYSLIINGTSDIQPATDQGEPASNIYWTSLKILYGFQLIHAPNEILCHDLKGCSPYSSLPYERLFNITSIPSYPLSDIMAEYSIVSIDKKPVFCLQIAPVGYQHPVWRNIFIFIPVAITLIAAMISFVVSVIGFNVNENYDIILFTSNYATVPGVLKLKTPGFFDLMFYAQFIVLLSQFNLEYPRFYPLFSSNFSWSFLLYNAKWLQSVLVQQFPSAALNKDSPIHNEPGLSLYRRQLNDSSISNNGSMITKPSNHVTVDGTGMADFSNAIGIDINGLFLNMIVHLAIVLGACLVVCLFVYIFLYLSGRIDRSGSLREKMKRMNDFFIGILIRVLSLFYIPIMTISFYQLMIPSYWYITLMAAVILVMPCLSYGFIILKLLHIKPPSFLFTELNLLLRYGSLYNLFTDECFHFFILIIFHQSVLSIMIGLFQASGLAQLIVALLIEVVLFVSIYLKFPYVQQQMNIQQLIFSATRFIILMLNIAYLPNIKASVMAKQYIGYIQLVIHCLIYLLSLILLMRNATVLLLGLREELNDSGKPSIRIAFWKNRQGQHPREVEDTPRRGTADRSQTTSLYLLNAPESSHQTLNTELLPGNPRYSHLSNNTSSIRKPDEIRVLPTTCHNNSDTDFALPGDMIEYQRYIRPTSLDIEKYLEQRTAKLDATSSEEMLNNTGIRQSYPMDDTFASSSQNLIPQKTTTASYCRPKSADHSPPAPGLPRHIYFDTDQ